jgi:transcriptional activator for dhaKLM operon
VLASGDPDPKPVISMKEAEREAILRAGWACKGVVSKMAEVLDIGRTTLWRKMRELDIAPEQFK